MPKNIGHYTNAGTDANRVPSFVRAKITTDRRVGGSGRRGIIRVRFEGRHIIITSAA